MSNPYRRPCWSYLPIRQLTYRIHKCYRRWFLAGRFHIFKTRNHDADMEYIMIGGAVTETHCHGQGAYEGDQEPARRQIQKRNDNMTDALGKPMDFKLLSERHGDICSAGALIQAKELDILLADKPVMRIAWLGD